MSCLRILACLSLILLFSLKAGIQEAVRAGSADPGSRTTAERLRAKTWWPTSGRAAPEDYVGSDACARCHQAIAATQPQSRMARAASRASQTSLLELRPQITGQAGGYTTTIRTRAGASTYSVARGAESMSGDLSWTIGSGKLGFTFLLHDEVGYYESQLSYFTAIDALDLTPGHTQSPFSNLIQVFGEPLSPKAAAQCLGCHTTRSSQKSRFTPQAAIPGVTCEACHGPGAAHVKAMEQHRFDAGRQAILDPIALSPAEQLDFCGACHRSPRDITAIQDFSPIDIRFQPYRLSKSRCWSIPDPRLACSACHNPHQKLEEVPAAYDSKCLACHSNRGSQPTSAGGSLATHKQPACPVATANCVKCHMPRYNIPQMHGAFTDHDIRIVRPGENFPL